MEMSSKAFFINSLASESMSMRRLRRMRGSVPGAEAVAETHEVRPPAQAAEDSPDPSLEKRRAPGEAAGDAAAAEGGPAERCAQEPGGEDESGRRGGDAQQTDAPDAAAKVLAEEGLG